jgi:hypothetical protein
MAAAAGVALAMAKAAIASARGVALDDAVNAISALPR